MPDYLILKRTGEGDLDLEPQAVIRGKTAAAVDEAIKEGALDGPGPYLALSYSGAVERDLTLRPEIAPKR